MKKAYAIQPVVQGNVVLDNKNLLTVVKIRDAMAVVGVFLSDSQIVNGILNTITSKASYVSILPMSSKTKVSLPEIEKLLDLHKNELQAIEYLKSQCLEQLIVRLNLDDLKRLMKSTGELPVNEDVENKVNDLHEELENVFFKEYKQKPFRAGYKKLIIKVALMSAIYS